MFKLRELRKYSTYTTKHASTICEFILFDGKHKISALLKRNEKGNYVSWADVVIVLSPSET